MPSLHISPLGSGKPVGQAFGLTTDAAHLVPPPVTQSHAPNSGISVEADAGYEAGQPPVDSARVTEIRAAIENGTYPIVPLRIVDAMIAVRLFPSIG